MFHRRRPLAASRSSRRFQLAVYEVEVPSGASAITAVAMCPDGRRGAVTHGVELSGTAGAHHIYRFPSCNQKQRDSGSTCTPGGGVR